MGAGDFGGVVEVGDGLGDFEEAVEDTSGKVKFVSGGLHEGLGFVIHLDEAFEIARSHAGVGSGGAETSGLGGAGGDNTLANGCAG